MTDLSPAATLIRHSHSLLAAIPVGPYVEVNHGFAAVQTPSELVSFGRNRKGAVLELQPARFFQYGDLWQGRRLEVSLHYALDMDILWQLMTIIRTAHMDGPAVSRSSALTVLQAESRAKRGGIMIR